MNKGKKRYTKLKRWIMQIYKRGGEAILRVEEDLKIWQKSTESKPNEFVFLRKKILLLFFCLILKFSSISGKKTDGFSLLLKSIRLSAKSRGFTNTKRRITPKLLTIYSPLGYPSCNARYNSRTSTTTVFREHQIKLQNVKETFN